MIGASALSLFTGTVFFLQQLSQPLINLINYRPSIGQEAFLCLKETCKLIEIGSAFIVALGHKLRVQVCCELACSSALQFSSNVLNMLLS